MATKTLAGGGRKTETAEESETTILEPGSQKEGVGKAPEQQTVLDVSGEKVAADSPFGNAGDGGETVHLNHVGQKINKPIKDAETYVTPDGKQMTVQMEEADQVFAGEHGRNAKWYPKKVVETWTKLSSAKKGK